MGLSGISKSTVSKLCKDIDERVREFLDRPLTGDWPYLWLDATYLKVREGGRIVSVAAIIAVAVEHRRAARDHRPVRRPVRGRDVLDRVPAQPARPGPRRAEAGDLRRPHRPQGRDRAGLRGHLATVPRSLDAQRAGPCARRASTPSSPPRSGRPSTSPTRRRRRDLAPRRRPAPPPLAEAGRPDGRERGRRAGLHGLPGPAPHQAAQHQPDRAPEQGGQAPRRCRRDLPQRGRRSCA